MSDMINIGIDLGTTNSLIARFVKGTVEVFRNPTALNPTLPSVVGFRKDKILVGDQARTYMEKDPKSVFGRFKRKMGTTESFKVRALGQSKTPVELSAYVLKELKTFVPTSEDIEAVVITIPASFDTIQSNATKEAGFQAGFKQVVLLQEPIAASIAYANKRKEKDLKNGQWLVYDLGGGTFDVALIRIQDGEMKVLDHEGDNYLGGMDFDNRVVDTIIVPHLQKNCKFNDLATDLKSESGKHNGLYYKLLHKVEEAKIILSSRTSAEIEFDLEDDAGSAHDVTITITRSEFEGIIKSDIDRTSDMIKTILTRNSLRSRDVQFVLMVGGSTYIPYVRRRIEELLEIRANCDIDPITAVAAGAAYFAGTKEKKFESAPVAVQGTPGLRVKMAYAKASKEDEELLSIKVVGKMEGLSYRIVRDDGGFDSGLRPLAARINEDLPLVKDEYNLFRFAVYDQKGNVVPTDAEMIQIAQGKYSIAGQPLPEDICIEVDDPDNKTTKLRQIFGRNAVLPLRTTMEVLASRTLLKGSNEEIILISVLEGPEYAVPAANKLLGYLVIKGRDVKRDIIRGTSIELTVEMSESRDLTVAAFVTTTDQMFKETFSPTKRHVPVAKLTEEIAALQEKVQHEIREATEREEYEVAKELKKAQDGLMSICQEAEKLTPDDVTDARYQLEDRKRKLAQEIDNATKSKRISQLRIEYEKEKDLCFKIVSDNGNDQERRHYNEIVAQENVVLSSNNPIRIQDEIGKLVGLRYSILWRTPGYLVWLYKYLGEQRQKLNDQTQAKSLFDAGRAAIASENFDRLAEINGRLMELLPQADAEQVKRMTGIM